MEYWNQKWPLVCLYTAAVIIVWYEQGFLTLLALLLALGIAFSTVNTLCDVENRIVRSKPLTTKSGLTGVFAAVLSIFASIFFDWMLVVVSLILATGLYITFLVAAVFKTRNNQS